jgi:hypothetical protein
MGPFKDGWTKEQVEETILRGKVDELLYVPIVVGLSPPDFEWADSVLRRLVGHEFWVFPISRDCIAKFLTRGGESSLMP